MNHMNVTKLRDTYKKISFSCIYRPKMYLYSTKMTNKQEKSTDMS